MNHAEVVDSRRGLLLAGGLGTRFWPVTSAVSKHLMPVYDKPLIYYSLSTLMLAGARSIVIVTTPRDLESYQALLGDGSRWGMDFNYKVQADPAGIVDALAITRSEFNEVPFMVVLGDNLLHASHLRSLLKSSWTGRGVTIFGASVPDVREFGALRFSSAGTLERIVEKPDTKGPGLAIPGVYFYGADLHMMFDLKELSCQPGASISMLNQNLLERSALNLSLLARGTFWSDVGTPSRMAQATAFVGNIQSHSGTLIGSPDEIALRNGWINWSQFQSLVAGMPLSMYRSSLESLSYDT